MGVIRQIRVAEKEKVKQEYLRVSRKYCDCEVLSDNEQAILIEGYGRLMGVVIDPTKLKREMDEIALVHRAGLVNEYRERWLISQRN